jgi:DNA-binding response OmpR family regulator
MPDLSAAAPGVHDPPGPAPRALRILVADDEPSLRLAITSFLRRRGHQVVEAADAHEARRIASEQTFDAALIDARMPGDGLLLLQELDASESLRGRTALMSGDPGRGRHPLEVTGGRPYLTKPFDMQSAVALLERLGR